MTTIRRRKRRKYEYETVGGEAVGMPLQLQLGRKASRRSKSHEKVPSPQFACRTETGLNLLCNLIFSKIVSLPVVVVLLREMENGFFGGFLKLQSLRRFSGRTKEGGFRFSGCADSADFADSRQM
ncbi:hypothetical protein ACFX2H_005900 [Malus domestica]